MSLALARLLDDPGFGAPEQPAPSPLEETLAPGTGDEATVRVSFDPASGQPYCTNNLASDVPATGWNATTVAPRTAHLVAVGECRGLRRVFEADLHVPRYPYALSASGPIRSNGSLQVLGARLADDISDTGQVPENRLVQADVASNSAGTDPSIVLGPLTRIVGNVVAAGAVQIDPAARVEGEVRDHGAPVPLAEVRLRDYDPAGRPGVEELPRGEYAPTPDGRPVRLRGLLRRQGDLRITGGVDLDRGVLFVDGDLVIEGPVKGRGALFVTGRTTLGGGARLRSDNEAALVSGGEVVVRGSGTENSLFRGLIYTESDFTAENVTLVGAFVAHGPAGRGRVTLTNTRTVLVPTAGEFTFDPLVGVAVDLGRESGGYGWRFESRATLSDFDLGEDVPEGQNRYDLSRVTREGARMEYLYGGFHLDRGRFLLRMAREALPRADLRSPSCRGAGTWSEYLDCEERQILDALRQHLARANQEWRQFREDALWAREFRIDLNRFVAFSDRARVRLWREAPGGG